MFKGAAVGYFILVVAPAVIPDDGEHEDHHDEEQGDELFIPFPGTTKTLPGQPYMKNSPEVREFARISQDPKLQNQLKRGLRLDAVLVDPAADSPARGHHSACLQSDFS